MCLSLRIPKKSYLAFRVLFAFLSLTGLTRAGDLTGVANLFWDINPETNIAGYRVLHGTASGALTQSQAVHGNIPTAVVSGLETGMTHYFAVLAYNSSGLEGPPSDEVAFFVEAPTAAEISIERPPSAVLATGGNNTFLGEVKAGTKSAATEFVIRNTGTASLTGLAMEIDGADHPNFSVSTDLPCIPVLTSNAAFNANFSAWTTSGNLRIIRDTTSPGGGNVADFNFSNTTPNGSISQNFPTTPGTTYTLTFDVGILSLNSNPQAVLATATGTDSLLSETIRVNATGNRSTQWDSHRFTFVADSTRTQLTLTDVSTSTDGADVRLDNIRVIDSARSADGPAALTLEPGESSSFHVTFSPSSAGAKAAYLHIFSNDADESPFDLTLSGTGVAQFEPPTLPEIEIRRAVGTDLISGAATIPFDDTLLGSSAEFETLVITNTGTADLTGLSAFIDGLHADDFATELPAVDLLAPGESTIVRIHFKPTSVGSKNAVLQISSNDADESIFAIALKGNGTTPTTIPTPEISVGRANGVNLDNRDPINFGGILLDTASVTEFLTVRNTGTAVLTGLAITLDGSNTADFILGGSIANSLAPGASTSFTVIFKPTTSGTRSAVIRVTSNDADENPFDIAVSGTGIAVPEIAVERANGTGLTDALSTIDFTGITLGTTSAVEVLTLRNSGTAALTGITASISGIHAADFILEAPGANTLPPGSTTTLKISFKPTSTGARNAVIRIASNDTDENPFDIAVNGNGIATPNITVTSSSFPGSPAGVDLGSVEIGASSVAMNFTITNSGSANLTGVQLALDGPQAGDFVVESPTASTLLPGSNTAFRVSFRPTGGGYRSATLRIASNDPDTKSYDIALSGRGLAVPRIALFRSDGSQVLGGSNTVPFGSVDLGSVSTTETFIIRNTGSATLTNLAAIATGISAADFPVSALETAILTPGSSTSFTVSFKPLGAGSRSAVLQLASDESGPLTVTLTGTGNAFPVMTLKQLDGTQLMTIPDFGSLLVGSVGKPLTLRIANQGTAVLSGLWVSTGGPNGSDFNVTQPAATSLEPGAETSFDVVFKPSNDGTKTAVLRISNANSPNDSSEFVLTGNAVTTPAIALFDAEGSDLSTGEATVSFGNLDIRAAPKSRTFSIKSTGTAALAGITILKEGPNASDFSVVATGLESIAPGASASFSISFNPAAAGNRTAAIRIVSNAGHDIVATLSGKGLAAPEIKIEAADKNLKSGESFVNFGTSPTSVRGETRTFTISNVGSASLERISLARNGIDAGDFIVTALKTTTLAPGKSTTFNVSFKPTESGIRWAGVNISSNDMDEKAFTIGLTGKGTNRPDSAQAVKPPPGASATLTSDKLRTGNGIEIIGGRKYRTLTIRKPPGATVNPRDIEVSTDLIHWSSGPRHTTVLRESKSTLTVRDNTPVGQVTKRHIRLRP